MKIKSVMWCGVCLVWSVAVGCKSAPPENQEATSVAEQPSEEAERAESSTQSEEARAAEAMLVEELAESEEPEVEGQMDKQVIREVVLKNKNSIRFCYETHLQDNPTLAGRVDVSFLIGETGAVQSAEVVTSTLAHQGVEACVLKRIETFEFPAPEGGVVKVIYPFIFGDEVGEPGEVTGGEPVLE